MDYKQHMTSSSIPWKLSKARLKTYSKGHLPAHCRRKYEKIDLFAFVLRLSKKMSDDFFTNVFKKGISQLTLKEYLSHFEENGQTLARGTIFLLECVGPVMIYSFPKCALTFLFAFLLAFFSALFNKEAVDLILNVYKWISNRRPLTIWIICYNVECLLGLIYTETNFYALLFVLQLMFVDFCHYI